MTRWGVESRVEPDPRCLGGWRVGIWRVTPSEMLLALPLEAATYESARAAEPVIRTAWLDGWRACFSATTAAIATAPDVVSARPRRAP